MALNHLSKGEAYILGYMAAFLETFNMSEIEFYNTKGSSKVNYIV